MNQRTALAVNNISKHYEDGDKKIDVIQNLSFGLNAGQSLSLTGPSGSGKSTLLNLLAGLIEVDHGDMSLNLGSNNFDYASATEKQRTALRRQHIGYVYQLFNLVPTLTVLENVKLPARLNKRQDLEGQAKANRKNKPLN